MQGRAPNCTGAPSCYSSRCAIPHKGRSYKPIENFLRRIAFNLGNSVSQTDVKILSCIPIDVTDLQQRITQLEKELAEEKGKDKDKEDKEGGSRRASKASKASKPEEGKEEEKEETVAWLEQSKATKTGKEVEKDGTVEWVEKSQVTKKTTSSNHKNYIQNYLHEDTNEVHPLYTAKTDNKYNDTGRYDDIENSAASSSVYMDPATQHSSGRIKKQKHNPFSVFLGNLKRRKHSNDQKYPSKRGYDEFGYSASSLSITVCPMSKTNDREEYSENEDKYQKYQTNTKRKKKPNKVKERSSNQHNQFVYYAQTDSHFNPIYKTKQDNKECNMLYIANLIEKQYGSTGLLEGNKGLHRQYSVPVCHDKRYLSHEYPISSFGPHSCYAESNSRNDINRGIIDNANTCNNPKGPSQEYNYYSSQNKGRFYDCTQYDIVPVKQKASKKYSDQAQYDSVGHRCGRNGAQSPSRKSCYPDIDPPLNLHPAHSYEIIRNRNERLQHTSRNDRGLRRREAKSYVIKKHSPKRSCLRKSTNRHKMSIDPEDIYLQSTNTEPAITKRTHTRKKVMETQVEPENKSNEITEVKTMLQEFITEIRQDIPKFQENLNAKPEDYQGFTPKPSANQCAFIPGFPQIIPAGQCCPILYPINFMTSSHTNHACIHTTPTLHKEHSECCIKKVKSDVNTPTNQQQPDSLSETKKLIEEIYKSVALQNANNEYNTKAVDAKNNETMKDIVNSSSTMPSSDSQDLQRKSSLNPSPSDRKLSEHNTETESKEQNSDRSPSSLHTDSYIMYSDNAGEPSVTKIKTEKKGAFSNFMQALKLSFTKNKETNSKFGTPSYGHNVVQYSDTCHQNKLQPSSKMYGKSTSNGPRANTHSPEDMSKYCYNDSKHSSGQYSECNPERPHAYTQYSKSRPIRRHQDQRPYRYGSDEPKNCFYMSEPQQIPFCLKEIEVKNVSTQVKKKKLFGILRRLKHGTDSDTSFEQHPPRMRANYEAPTAYVPVHTGYKKKKPGFLELLKGHADFDYSNEINKYNLANDSESTELKPGKYSFFSPKQSSPISKKSGKWTKYMQKVEKAKKRDMARNMLYKNPLSFKNILMKTLIGHKPVPNTKPAKPFF